MTLPLQRLVPLALVLALVAGACGSGDGDTASTTTTTTSTSSTTSSTSTTSSPTTTTTTTTTTSTTTTTTAPPVAVSDTALSLAAVMETGAYFVEDSWLANSAADPLGEALRVTEEYVAHYAALPRTEATAAPIDEMVDGFDALADLYERYIPLLQDPSSAVTAVDGFLAELVTVSEASTAAELTLVDLAVEELASRNTPVGDYFVTTTGIQLQSGLVIEDFLGELANIAADPEGVLLALEPLIDALGELGVEIGEITPPDALAEYHRRHVSFLRGYGDVFGELIDNLRDGVEPRTSSLLQMQRLAEEAPTLNAARSLLMAQALRGEFD